MCIFKWDWNPVVEAAVAAEPSGGALRQRNHRNQQVHLEPGLLGKQRQGNRSSDRAAIENIPPATGPGIPRTDQPVGQHWQMNMSAPQLYMGDALLQWDKVIKGIFSDAIHRCCEPKMLCFQLGRITKSKMSWSVSRKAFTAMQPRMCKVDKIVARLRLLQITRIFSKADRSLLRDDRLTCLSLKIRA